MKTGPKPKPEAERFWPLVVADDESDCWFWAGTVNNMGYGMFRVGSQTDGSRRKVLAHRWAYHDAYGEWPKDDADHVCHNRDLACPGGRRCLHRRCVRPDHLEDAPRALNLQRGRGPSKRRSSKSQTGSTGEK